MNTQDLKKISLVWRGDERAMLHNFNPYYGNKTAVDFMGNRKYSQSMDKLKKGVYPWYRIKGRARNYINAITLPGFEILKRVLDRPDFRELAVNLAIAA